MHKHVRITEVIGNHTCFASQKKKTEQTRSLIKIHIFGMCTSYHLVKYVTHRTITNDKHTLNLYFMNRNMLFSLVLIFLAASLPLSAQVSIAPSTVFIDDQTKIGTVYVSNRSDDPQEVSIDFAFGYPASDEDGNLVMTYEDSLAYERYAINEWIRAFPRSFVLGPRQQQTVRFQVRPQPQAEDGVYWTRVRILANPQEAEIDMATEEEGITTRISFRFEQIIAAFYKKGQTTTGVNVKEVRYATRRTVCSYCPGWNAPATRPLSAACEPDSMTTKETW